MPLRGAYSDHGTTHPPRVQADVDHSCVDLLMGGTSALVSRIFRRGTRGYAALWVSSSICGS